jgi:hypothetical protein
MQTMGNLNWGINNADDNANHQTQHVDDKLQLGTW